jgi:hypothetical protein
MLNKEVQIIGPFGTAACVGINVPEMRHLLFFEIVMDALAVADQAILIAARQP